MPAAVDHATEPGWASAWAAALDALELSLDETERLLRGDAPGTTDALTTWAPPELQGPMPVDLRTRALALHHRQQQIIKATQEAAGALRKQAALTSRMSTARSEPNPIYLDVNA